MEKPTIGITGASGFIGRHLMDALLRQGYPVIALSRKKDLVLPSKVKVINGDLTDGCGLPSFLEKTDILIHLAARILPPEEEMFKDNVITTWNLISEALKHKIKKVIYISSIVVYGDNKGKKFKESDECHPSTEYGLSKYLAEKLIQFWAVKTGNSAVILRPFNIYGPGNKKGIIHDFYEAIKKTDEVTIYGDGKQKRDFLYIDDAVELVSRLINNSAEGIYNIGTGENYAVSDLPAKFGKILNKKIRVAFDSEEKGKVYSILYDITKVEKELGWKSGVSLDNGLKKTISWYERKNIQ